MFNLALFMCGSIVVFCLVACVIVILHGILYSKSKEEDYWE